MAQIRQLTAADFDQRTALMQFAFQMKLSPERIEEMRTAFRPERVYGLYDESGRMLSALTLLPFETWIRGKKMAMGGVAGVITWPDARRQGGVKRLLLHAFERMKSEGQSISMLAPFHFPFYRKYGYEFTIERKNYTLDSKHLPPRVETPGAVKLVDKHMGLFDPVYEAFARRYDGTLVRDEEWWRLRVFSKPGLAAVYYNEAGNAEGYLLYEVADRLMTVHDWVALNEEARVGLWSFAANHDSMIDRLKVTVPADDPLGFLVPEPRFKQEIEPYFMSRIVDAEAFLAQYPFAPSDGAEEWTLSIDDAHAVWNDGVFRLRIEADGSARLERIGSNGVEADTAGLACDIGTLTALLVGGRSGDLLHRIGRLRGPWESAMGLNRRIPRHNPYLADFF